MTRGRAAGYEQQRHRILAEAARLFAEQGYAATTMNQVAEASGLSKATLYHYHRDKHSLLASICDERVSTLADLVHEVMTEPPAGTPLLERLIHRVVLSYGGAEHAHRVLTEDVKFLLPADRERVLGKERAVVSGFARALVALHPELQASALTKPLTMLLFGMMNWTFTWMRADGQLTHTELAPVVARLFMAGVTEVVQQC